MASLTKKIINGHAYYYLRECQRVDGKPKVVRQIYLGSVEAIQQRFETSPELPQTVEALSFGLPTALLAVAHRLDLIQLIDQHCPKRQQGLSIGHYLVLAAINRCCHPKSKNQFYDWYRQTALSRLMPVPAQSLSSQRFWDNMQKISLAQLQAIETALAARVLEQEDVNAEILVYDTTNFFTYLHADTESDLAQWGHNKQKRSDLRQVGLALLVAHDGRIPLLYEMYPGHLHDSEEFAVMLARLQRRCHDLGIDPQTVTLIFDKGNNAQANIARCAPFHYVGSLVPTQHDELLDIPTDRYTPLSDTLSYFLTEKVVYGTLHRICLTRSRELLQAQQRGVRIQAGKRLLQLDAECRRLTAWAEKKITRGKAPTVESVRHKVATIVKGQHMETLIATTVSIENGAVTLDYEWNTDAYETLSERLLGKSFLFSDHLDWSAHQIITGCHTQYLIEDDFKQLKHRRYVSFYPIQHWTDQKLRVHACYCVLALLLVNLLQRDVRRAGLEVSVEQLIEGLSAIQEVNMIFPATGRGKAKCLTKITELTPEQAQLYTILGLEKYAG
jgi:transposase